MKFRKEIINCDALSYYEDMILSFSSDDKKMSMPLFFEKKLK